MTTAQLSGRVDALICTGTVTPDEAIAQAVTEAHEHDQEDWHMSTPELYCQRTDQVNVCMRKPDHTGDCWSADGEPASEQES
jgi:hypothetical protein